MHGVGIFWAKCQYMFIGVQPTEPNGAIHSPGTVIILTRGSLILKANDELVLKLLDHSGKSFSFQRSLGIIY